MNTLTVLRICLDGIGYVVRTTEALSFAVVVVGDVVVVAAPWAPVVAGRAQDGHGRLFDVHGWVLLLGAEGCVVHWSASP